MFGVSISMITTSGFSALTTLEGFVAA